MKALDNKIVKDICAFYSSKNVSVRKVASHFKVSPSVVTKYLTLNNIKIIPRRGITKLPPTPKFVDAIKNAYEGGKHVKTIAKKYGVAPITIYKYLMNHGIRRPPSKHMEFDLVMVQELLNEGYSLPEIAAKFKVYYQRLYYFVKVNRLHIPVRKKRITADDIKHKLAKIAPLWEVYAHYVTIPNPAIFFHLRRFDYSVKAPDQPEGYKLECFIFAKKDVEKEKFYLLTKSPIVRQ